MPRPTEGRDVVRLRAGSAEFSLRRAMEDDVPAIVDLLADDQLGGTPDGVPGTDLAPYRRALAAIDADSAQLLVVAAVDDDVVGTMQLTFIPGMAQRGLLRAQIESVRMQRSWRSRGMGEAMIRWAIDEAGRRGCGLVQLTSNKQRVDAHRFYRRLGFDPSHEGFKLYLRR